MTDTPDALKLASLTDGVEWGDRVNTWKGYLGKDAPG